MDAGCKITCDRSVIPHDKFLLHASKCLPRLSLYSPLAGSLLSYLAVRVLQPPQTVIETVGAGLMIIFQDHDLHAHASARVCTPSTILV